MKSANKGEHLDALRYYTKESVYDRRSNEQAQFETREGARAQHRKTGIPLHRVHHLEALPGFSITWVILTTTGSVSRWCDLYTRP